MVEKCPEKMEAKLQPVENVLVVIKHQAVVKQKKFINCMGKENNTNIDHTTYDRHCPSMKQKKTESKIILAWLQVNH